MQKDIWDILEALTPLITGGVVTVVVLLITNSFNRTQALRTEALKEQELLIAKVQAAEKFFPHLNEGEESKKLALLMMASLGFWDVIALMATYSEGSGSVAALSAIADKGPAEQRSLANHALKRLFASVVTVEVSNA